MGQNKKTHGFNSFQDIYFKFCVFIYFRKKKKKTIKVKFLGPGEARSLAHISCWVIIWHLAPLFPALVISREMKMLSSYLPASLCCQRPWERLREKGDQWSKLSGG